MYDSPMLRIASLLGLCAVFTFALDGRTPARQRARKGDLAIVGATVLPMDRAGTLAGYTVLVRGERIVAVLPAAQLDARAATILDAKGKWVLPGLADMHVHLWDENAFALLLLNGVTTVRNLFGSPDHLRWRGAIARGELAGPTLITAGPIIDGDPPVWPGSAVVTTPRAARAEVAAQQAAGYDWLKVYNGLSLEVYDAVLDEAKRRRMPVAGHVPKAVGLARAIASGQRSIEHLDGYVPFFGEPPADPLLGPTVKSGLWNCPTLVVTERFGRLDNLAKLADTRGLEFVSPVTLSMWDPKNDFRLRTFTPEKYEAVRTKNRLRAQRLLELQRAKARIVLGTDTGNPYVIPGFAVADELALMVGAGLTPWEALRTATAAASELQGSPGSFGVIRAGARADLIVIDRDPLADIARVADPSTVVVRGVPHARAELLAAARKPAPPADPFAKLPALEPEGVPVVAARYEVLMFDQVIGGERAVLGRAGGKGFVVKGQAVYTAPQATQIEYRSTHDALELTTASLDPAQVAVSRKDQKIVAVQGTLPPLELAAAADAVIAPQTIAEFFWYAAALEGLPVGEARTLGAVEVITDGRLALHPGRFTFTRAADLEGRRVYAITGKHGDLDLAGRLTVDADGAPHEVTVTLKYGSFLTRRTG